MPELQTAVGTSAGIQSRYLTDAVEIERAFRVFREQHAPLSLRFEGTASTFTARVLDIAGGRLVLDDIRPRDGLRLLHRAVPFSVTGRTDGIYAYAEDLRVIEAAAERGVPYFLVPLPSRLLYQQRRRATRFRLPTRVTANGSLVRLVRGDTAIEGIVIDISSGGCRAAFTAPTTPPLAVDDIIERCEVAVPNVLSIAAVAAIRHQILDAKNGEILCGIEFLRMDVADRRRLEQFIQSLARTASDG